MFNNIITLLIGFLALLGTNHIYQVTTHDYKPNRPNKSSYNNDIYLQVEKDFKDPRVIITRHNSMYSVLTRQDGRKYLITEQTPGTYIDVTVKDGMFRSGTLLMKGDCVTRTHYLFDNSHCR